MAEPLAEVHLDQLQADERPWAAAASDASGVAHQGVAADVRPARLRVHRTDADAGISVDLARVVPGQVCPVHVVRPVRSFPELLDAVAALDRPDAGPFAA